MLECKLCDYYKTLSGHGCSNTNAAKCEFTGMSFFDNVENLNIDYPCKKISYMDYLNRTPKIISSVNIFMSEDWRHTYRKDHVKEAPERVTRGAV